MAGKKEEAGPGGGPLEHLIGGEGHGGNAEEQDELVGIISHDLRSPLANIRSYAGMLLSGRGPQLDQRARRAAEVIARNADRGLRQIDEIIELFRLQSGALALEHEETPLDELVRSAIQGAEPVAAEKEARLGWAPPGPGVIALGDRARLLRAIQALLEGALRRSAQGSELSISTQLDRGTLTLLIEDGGFLPDEDDRALAFDWRGQALEVNHLSPGLSLALSRAIARAHGGDAALGPGASGGGRWSLTLPAAAVS